MTTAVGEWPGRPVVLAVAWKTLVRPEVGDEYSGRVLSRFAARDAAAFESFVREQAPLLTKTFEAAPGRGAEVASRLKAMLAPGPTAAKLALLELELKKSDIANGTGTPGEKATAIIAVTAEAQLEAAKASGENPCLVAGAFVDHMPQLVAEALSPFTEGALALRVKLICPEARVKVVGAVLDQLRAINLEPGGPKRVVTKAARRCCWDSMWSECNQWKSLEECDESDIKQIAPPEYGYEDPEAPARDLVKLRRVADALTVLSLVSERGEARELQDRVTKFIADFDSVKGSTEALARGEEELKELRRDRDKYFYLRAYMVSAEGDNVYEIALLQAVPSCRGMFCSSPPIIMPSGTHAVLRTTETRFTSKGQFGLWVKSGEKVSITTTSGFTEQWNSYIEASEWEAKGLDAQISEKRKELAALKKAAPAEASRLEKERRALVPALVRLEAALTATPAALSAAIDSPP